jgi:hypothetical protein
MLVRRIRVPPEPPGALGGLHNIVLVEEADALPLRLRACDGGGGGGGKSPEEERTRQRLRVTGRIRIAGCIQNAMHAAVTQIRLAVGACRASLGWHAARRNVENALLLDQITPGSLQLPFERVAFSPQERDLLRGEQAIHHAQTALRVQLGPSGRAGVGSSGASAMLRHCGRRSRE